MKRKTKLCRKCRKLLADERRTYFREYQRKRRAKKACWQGGVAPRQVFDSTVTHADHVDFKLVDENVEFPRRSRARRKK